MRSRFLLLISTLAFLGFSGCDKKQMATTVLDNVSKSIVDDTGSVPVHNWKGYTFTVHNAKSDGGVIRIVGRHLSGPPADFVLMEKQEYDRLEPLMQSYKEHDYNYKSNASRLSLTGDFDSGWLNIPNGEYVFLIDNSGNFEASPTGKRQDETVNYSVTIKATDIRE